MPRCGRQLLRRGAEAAMDFVFPAWCLACQTAVPFPTPRLSLCGGCRRRLRLPSARCQLCGRARLDLNRTDLGTGWICEPCADARPLDGLYAAWSYESPAAEILLALKFGGLDYLAEDVADVLIALHGRQLGSIAENDASLVTEVPLHWRRRVERRYDQAEMIARAVAGRLGLPHRKLLRRVRATTPQSRLGGRQRRTNLEGAFRPRTGTLWTGSRSEVAGALVILVDDVSTTTTTLSTAARVLRQGGARSVIGLVAALTPAASTTSEASRSYRPGRNDHLRTGRPEAEK